MKIIPLFSKLKKSPTDSGRAAIGGGSIFVRIFASVVLIFLAMAVMLVFWCSSILLKNQREQIGQASINRITAAARSVDQSLADLSQSMSQLFWNSDFTRCMITGKADATQEYRMIRQLGEAVQGNTLVLRACFLAEIPGKMYLDNSYSVGTDSSTYEWFVLEASREEGARTRFSQNAKRHTTTYLYTYGTRLFLIQELDIGNLIGTVMYELDRKAMSDLINGGRDFEGGLFVYDSAGHAMLYGTPEYSSLHLSDGFITAENLSETAGNKVHGYYYTDNEAGWRFLLQLDSKSLQLDVPGTLLAFLPLLFILLVFSVGLSTYIRITIYRPIDRLMSLVSVGALPDGGGAAIEAEQETRKNEFRYLENAYSQAVNQRQQLAGMLGAVTPEIMENLMRSLIFGRDAEAQHISRMLEELGDPIAAKGRFVTSVCALEEPAGREVTATEWNLYHVSLRGMIADFARLHEDCRVYSVRVDERTLAVTLCFDSTITEVESKQIVAVLRKTLQNGTTDLPYHILMESGRACNGVAGLRDSYSEALERIRYQRYLGAEGQAEAESAALPETDADPTVDDGFGRFYARRQAQSAVRRAAGGKKEDAFAALNEIIEEMASKSGDVAHLRENGVVFLDEMVERLIAYPLNSEEQGRIAMYHAAEELALCADIMAAKNYLLGRSREIVQMVYVYNRKNRYKYVDQAKEYIAENYSNASLSLNAVAEHIGISGSYLSELFNEIAEERFSAYLARYRVEKAHQLQNATGLSVKEIGYQCGFNSSQNFIRVYKKYTGVTPGQYKEKP